MKKLLVAFLSFLSLCMMVYGQDTRTITGTVISSEDGAPVIGAVVLIPGTTKGATTDNAGKFTLNVPAGLASVEVSCLGMETMTVPVSAVMNITMKPDANMLEGVVVTGMQVMDRRLFTGASDQISGGDVALSGLADVSRGLEGKSAGVSVQNVSGTFGTAPKIRVRGATSIYGSSKPLWVVDGVIMEDVVEVSADDLSSGDAETLISSAIAGLNSEDIESFQILKDGSATSIYGARAMAGVIVVTTKKGQAGQSRINYTGEFTTRLIPSYSQFNIMNSQDQMAVYQEMQQKGWLNYAETANASASGVYGKMYQLISEYDPTTRTYGLANTPEAKAAYLRDAEYRNTDWFKLLFKNSVMQNHSVSISTGTEKAQVYASLSAMKDPGWTLDSEVKRFTGNVNATYKIFPNLTLNMIANASYRKQKAPGTLGSTVDVVTGTYKRDFDINPYSYALNTSRTLDPDAFYTRNYAPFNILYELDNNYIDLTVFNQRYQGSLSYKPIKDLEIVGLAAVEYTTTSQEHYVKDESNQALAYREMSTSTIRNNNSFLYTDPDNIFALPISVLPYGGFYERTDRSMSGWTLRSTANYNHTFNMDHIVNLFGGAEVQSTDRHSTWFRGWGMQYGMGEIPNYSYEAFKKSKEAGDQYYSLVNTHVRSAAFFANATYSYKGKYTLNGTIRYEGTNGMGESRQSRWLPTWNIAGAWHVHEEPFFEPIRNTMSHLTLKASYSLTADRPSVSNAQVVIGSTTPWKHLSSLQESALYISELANEDLTYEKKKEFNIGADMGFLGNRINLSTDVYWRNNYDLIGLATTQGVGGQVQKFGNIAAMKSNGLELTLSTTNIQTKDFKWQTNFIYSHTHNEVTDLETATRVIDLVRGSGFAREGYPVRGIFSIPFAGLNEEGLPTFYDPDGNVTVSGIYFQESDQDKLDFLEYSGSIDPTDVGSLGNVFTYKNFRLNVFVTYSFGNVIRLDPVFSYSYNDLDSMTKEFENRWVVPGDENVTTIPVIASSRQVRNDSDLSIAYNSYNYSTERIAKGDFIRLKEVSLTYDFNKSFVERLKLKSLSVKLQATNLALLYADKKLNGQDPEFANAGGVAIPVPRQFTFTLKLGL